MQCTKVVFNHQSEIQDQDLHALKFCIGKQIENNKLNLNNFSFVQIIILLFAHDLLQSPIRDTCSFLNTFNTLLLTIEDSISDVGLNEHQLSKVTSIVNRSTN